MGLAINLGTRILLGICVLGAFLHPTSGQCPPLIEGPFLTYADVQAVIDCEWKDTDRRDELIRDAINSVDLASEFENLTGVTIGTVIAVLIVIIIVPNLVILLLIFLCCYCCKCGLFSKEKRAQNNYYQAPAPSNPSYAPKPVGPAVPPKPYSSQSPPPQQAPSSGMWPWGKEETAHNRNQNGIQNQGYNGQY